MSQVADALTGPLRAPRAEGPVVSGLRGGVTRPAADAAAAPVSDAPGGSARRPRPRIAIRPAPYGSVRRLEVELGVSPVVAQVLVRRGLADPARAGDWLAADERHRLEEFGGLADAAERLLGHIRAGTRITVHGDYDVDGVCSTAILLEAIEGLGGRVDWHLPARDDGYGLSTATVERLAGRGTGCLLCVDCGITAVAEVAAARAAGLDAIVCDHHAPRADGALPDAAIVHPALGRYPCPELCAAGVAHRLAAALLRAAGEDEHRADETLDLVALATVADVVPLRGENRRLVREGLRALATTARPGLRALMSVAGCDAGRLDARAIGFGLQPWPMSSMRSTASAGPSRPGWASRPRPRSAPRASAPPMSLPARTGIGASSASWPAVWPSATTVRSWPSPCTATGAPGRGAASRAMTCSPG